MRSCGRRPTWWHSARHPRPDADSASPRRIARPPSVAAAARSHVWVRRLDEVRRDLVAPGSPVAGAAVIDEGLPDSPARPRRTSAASRLASARSPTSAGVPGSTTAWPGVSPARRTFWPVLRSGSALTRPIATLGRRAQRASPADPAEQTQGPEVETVQDGRSGELLRHGPLRPFPIAP